MQPPQSPLNLTRSSPVAWALTALVPLLSGIAAYLWTNAASPRLADPSSAKQGSSKEQRSRERDVATASGVSEALSAASEEDYRKRDARKAEIQAMDSDELKRSILDLMRRRLTDPSIDVEILIPPAPSPLDQLIRELGRKDRENALAWIEEHFPEKREAVIAGWAQGDSHGALSYIANCPDQGTRPCTTRTVMWALTNEATTNPGDLMEIAAQIPWERFDTRDDFPLMRVIYSPNLNYQPWVESGAARFLFEQGVPIRGILPAWFSDDPDAALSAWADWPQSRDGFIRKLDLNQMLDAALGSDDPARFAAALDANPGATEKFSAEVKRLIEVNKDEELESQIRQKLPNLLPSSSADSGQ